MLDLGVYVYRLAIDIAREQGHELKDFDKCKSSISYTPDDVDIVS